MKKILFIIVLALFLSGCLASFAFSTTFKDPNGTVYNVSAMYNQTTHAISSSIVYKGIEYKCEVIYDKSFDGNLVLTGIDLNLLESTGALWIQYKNEKYSCKASVI